MSNKAKSYDNNFDSFEELTFEPELIDKGFDGGITFEPELLDDNFTRSTFFDNTIEGDFIDNKYLNEFDNPLDIEGNREKIASRQPWGKKAANGLARVGTKIISEVAKMPGMAGGIIIGTGQEIADIFIEGNEYNFIETAFNNEWVKAINHAEEKIKEDILPVYVRKSVQEGNLWDNITSMDFWATEGADGLGFIAAMLAPGAVINKFNLGSKLLGVNKVAKLAENSKNAQAFLNTIGYTDKGANVLSSTLANTLFEAGVEAQSSMEAYKNTEDYKDLMDNRDELVDKYRTQLLNDYREGKYEAKTKTDAEGNVTGISIPSEQEILEEIDKEANQLADKYIRDEVGKIGSRVFLTNLAILLGPNTVTSKILYGSNKARKFKKNKIEVKDNGELTYKPLSKKQRLGEAAKTLVSGGAREGFFEEGMQSTAESYFTENPDKGLFDFAKDIGSAYMDMLDTTEGQKAIFLGALFGGGMNAYSSYTQSKKENESYQLLTSIGNKSLDSFYGDVITDIYETDENGIKYETTTDEKGEEVKKPVIDNNKLKLKLENLKNTNELSAIYDRAVINNDFKTAEIIKNKFVTDKLIKPFILNEGLGIKLLEEHLNNTTKFDNIPSEIIGDPVKFKSDILNKAKFLQKHRNLAYNMSYSLLNLESNNRTDEEFSKLFENITLDNYVSNLGVQYDVRQKLKELDNNFSNIYNDIYEDAKIEALKDAPDYVDSSNEDVYVKPSELKKEVLNNEILKKLNEERTSLRKDLNKINKDVNEFFNEKNINKKVKTFEKEYDEYKNIEEKSKKVQDVLDSINKATSLSELEEIESPFEEVNSEIGKAKEIKKAALTKKEEDDDEALKESNNNYVDNKKDEQNKLNNYIQHIIDNFQVGNTQNLFPSLDIIPEKFRKLKYKLVSKTDNSITIQSLLDPKLISTFTIKEDAPTTIKPINTRNIETNLPNEVEPSITKDDLISKSNLDEKSQPRIVITDNNKGAKKLPYDNITESALEFERNPVNKIGQKKGIEINTGNENGHSNPNWQKAVEMYNTKDFSDIQFLIKYLPINVKLDSNTVAPLETYSDNNVKDYNNIFDKSSKQLREVIIKELALNNVDIESIQLEIDGQWNGELQLDGINENNIADLYDFQNNISNITPDLFYVANKKGSLLNVEDDYLNTNRTSIAPGEIYIKIKTANGSSFPLKLNTLRHTPEQANGLYEIYKHFINTNFKELEEGIPLTNLPQELQDLIKDTFKPEIDLYADNKVPYDKLNIRDIINIMLYDGTNNSKTKIKVTKHNLLLGKTRIPLDKINDSESKDKFINFLTTVKRRNIFYKEDVNNPLYLGNKSYVDYLVANKILNTNAVVNTNTFAGKTTMYLSKKNIYVKGKISEFTQNNLPGYKQTLYGKLDTLKSELPNMFVNLVSLSEDETHYQNKNFKFDRVSNLKGKTEQSDTLNKGSIRGNIIDDALRLFFIKSMSKNDFIENFNNIIKERNPDSKIKMTDNFINELYSTFEIIKKEFNNRNWTIYSSTNPLKGNINILGEYDGNFAGTMDLLVYDNNTNEWIIVDLKTSSLVREDYYSGKQDDIYNYIEGDLIQQNAYRELFRQVNGVEPSKLFILPINVPHTNNVYDNVNFNSSNPLLEVDTSKDIYDLMKVSKTKPKSFNINNKLELVKGDGLVASNSEAIIPVTKDEITKAINHINNDEAVYITYNNEEYYFIPEMNIIINSNNKVVSKINDIDKILYSYNKEMESFGQPEEKIDKENVIKIWKSRQKAVYLQLQKNAATNKDDKSTEIINTKTLNKPSDIIDIDSLSENQAKEIIKNLRAIVKKSHRVKIMSSFVSGNNKLTLKNMLDLLTSLEYNKEVIKTKCNI